MSPTSRQDATCLQLLVVAAAALLVASHPFLSYYSSSSRREYGRNIQPLPCATKEGSTGVCMFAWDCMKANGTHLGTCIDRFYFGSCCKLKPGTPKPTHTPMHTDINIVATTTTEASVAMQTLPTDPDTENEIVDSTMASGTSPSVGSADSSLMHLAIGQVSEGPSSAAVLPSDGNPSTAISDAGDQEAPFTAIDTQETEMSPGIQEVDAATGDESIDQNKEGVQQEIMNLGIGLIQGQIKPTVGQTQEQQGQQTTEAQSQAGDAEQDGDQTSLVAGSQDLVQGSTVVEQTTEAVQEDMETTEAFPETEETTSDATATQTTEDGVQEVGQAGDGGQEDQIIQSESQTVAPGLELTFSGIDESESTDSSVGQQEDTYIDQDNLSPTSQQTEESASGDDTAVTSGEQDQTPGGVDETDESASTTEQPGDGVDPSQAEGDKSDSDGQQTDAVHQEGQAPVEGEDTTAAEEQEGQTPADGEDTAIVEEQDGQTPVESEDTAAAEEQEGQTPVEGEDTTAAEEQEGQTPADGEDTAIVEEQDGQTPVEGEDTAAAEEQEGQTPADGEDTAAAEEQEGQTPVEGDDTAAAEEQEGQTPVEGEDTTAAEKPATISSDADEAQSESDDGIANIDVGHIETLIEELQSTTEDGTAGETDDGLPGTATEVTQSSGEEQTDSAAGTAATTGEDAGSETDGIEPIVLGDKESQLPIGGAQSEVASVTESGQGNSQEQTVTEEPQSTAGQESVGPEAQQTPSMSDSSEQTGVTQGGSLVEGQTEASADDSVDQQETEGQDVISAGGEDAADSEGDQSNNQEVDSTAQDDGSTSVQEQDEVMTTEATQQGVDAGSSSSESSAAPDLIQPQVPAMNMADMIEQADKMDQTERPDAGNTDSESDDQGENLGSPTEPSVGQEVSDQSEPAAQVPDSASQTIDGESGSEDEVQGDGDQQDDQTENGQVQDDGNQDLIPSVDGDQQPDPAAAEEGQDAINEIEIGQVTQPDDASSTISDSGEVTTESDVNEVSTTEAGTTLDDSGETEATTSTPEAELGFIVPGVQVVSTPESEAPASQPQDDEDDLEEVEATTVPATDDDSPTTEQSTQTDTDDQDESTGPKDQQESTTVVPSTDVDDTQSSDEKESTTESPSSTTPEASGEQVNVTESSSSEVSGPVIIDIDAPLKNKTRPTTTPVLETQEDQLLHRLNTSSFKDICGQPVYPSKRIVGGAQASFGEWPWQVSLRQWRSVTYLHKCGAALVNENWAISAAHCVENAQPDQVLLRLGEYDLERTDEPYGHLERKVQIIATHPQFDPRTFEYDLALLRFNEPVKFQPNIIPICIPDNDYDFIGDTGFVSGWGRLYEDGPLPSVMQKVPVPVITNSECEVMYRNAGYIEDIPNIFICAGYEGGKRDSCEGDSGGPLVILHDGFWQLAGVISWGIGCALPNQPGVYTRISAFRDWINKIIVF